MGSSICLDNDDYLFSIANPVKAKPCTENVITQVYYFTQPLTYLLCYVNVDIYELE